MQSETVRASELDLRALLSREHARLERLFDDVVVAFRADDRELAATSWSAFDYGLRAHMDLEEELIVPMLARARPVEAVAIRREHDDIRRRLLELGIGVDLNLIKDDVVTDFVLTIRAHSHREDVTMYRWASEHLDDLTKASIRMRIRSVLTSLLHPT